MHGHRHNSGCPTLPGFDAVEKLDSGSDSVDSVVSVECMGSETMPSFIPTVLQDMVAASAAGLVGRLAGSISS